MVLGIFLNISSSQSSAIWKNRNKCYAVFLITLMLFLTVRPQWMPHQTFRIDYLRLLVPPSIHPSIHPCTYHGWMDPSQGWRMKDPKHWRTGSNLSWNLLEPVPVVCGWKRPTDKTFFPIHCIVNIFAWKDPPVYPSLLDYLYNSPEPKYYNY